MTDESPEVADAIRKLAQQVDTLGNAMRYMADTIAAAIRSTNTGGTGVSQGGPFTWESVGSADVTIGA